MIEMNNCVLLPQRYTVTHPSKIHITHYDPFFEIYIFLDDASYPIDESIVVPRK